MKLAMIVVATLLTSSPWVAGEETQKYLGLNEYRHVKPFTDQQRCGVDAWEDGNYFKNSYPQRLFTPNIDTLTIKLKGAYFDYAPETNWKWAPKPIVQVGIFADITVKGGSMIAPGTAGIPGRLVFFSENHMTRQRRIPDVNTNVYGPVLYTGGGLALKFSILEFDQSNGDKLADNLLKNIADLGAQASAGVPAYLQGPLTSLFQTALASAKSKDDLFGQITFVLDDRNGPDNMPTSPLRTGDIVFVRQSIRNIPVPWKDLCYKPSTGELFIDDRNDSARTTPASVATTTETPTRTGAPSTSEKPPQLNYVTISLVKNAGADVGRIQDALTYERFVSELGQRNTDTGLISSMTEVTTALLHRATERELFRQVDVLAMEAGSVSEMEKYDATARLSKVLYATGLEANKFDATTLKADPNCAYLFNERISPALFGRLFARLSRLNKLHTHAKFKILFVPSPSNCAEANNSLQAIHDQLQNPRQ